MKKILSYSEKGIGETNEDIVGAYGNTAWVLDGATPVFPRRFFSTNDVVWLVEQLNYWLPHCIDDDCSLEEILLKAINQVRIQASKIYRELDKVESFELPTFAVAMVRVMNRRLEYFILGDCGILVNLKDKVQYLTDKRLAKFSERNIKHIGQSKDTNKSKIQALQDTRKLLNTEEGYWIGSIDGKGIPHGITGTMNLDDQARVLCFSDGYSRLFELYKVTDINHFSFEASYINKTIRQIRKIEMEDADCSSYPRIKQSDDLSVILIEV